MLKRPVAQGDCDVTKPENTRNLGKLNQAMSKSVPGTKILKHALENEMTGPHKSGHAKQSGSMRSQTKHPQNVQDGQDRPGLHFNTMRITLHWTPFQELRASDLPNGTAYTCVSANALHVHEHMHCHTGNYVMHVHVVCAWDCACVCARVHAMHKPAYSRVPMCMSVGVDLRI